MAAEARGSTHVEFEQRRHVVNTRRTVRATGDPADLPRSSKALRCLDCGQMMRTLELSGYSGVVVQECRKHGWWLDAGEFEPLGHFVRTGGHLAARKRRLARLRMLGTSRRYRQRLRGEEPRIAFDPIGLLLSEWIDRD